jgi:hypothetical protein
MSDRRRRGSRAPAAWNGSGRGSARPAGGRRTSRTHASRLAGPRRQTVGSTRGRSADDLFGARGSGGDPAFGVGGRVEHRRRVCAPPPERAHVDGDLGHRSDRAIVASHVRGRRSGARRSHDDVRRCRGSGVALSDDGAPPCHSEPHDGVASGCAPTGAGDPGENLHWARRGDCAFWQRGHPRPGFARAWRIRLRRSRRRRGRLGRRIADGLPLARLAGHRRSPLRRR